MLPFGRVCEVAMPWLAVAVRAYVDRPDGFSHRTIHSREGRVGELAEIAVGCLRSGDTEVEEA